MIFKEITNIDQEKQHIEEISRGLVQLVNDPECTINKIISDLVQDNSYLDCFTKHLKINNKEFFEVDRSLLDLPLSQIKDILSFAGVSLNDLIQRIKNEMPKWEEEFRTEEETHKELRIIKHEVNLHKFWNYEDLEDICNLNRPDIYHDAYAIYEGPYNFLKGCATSLHTQLSSDSPNLSKCRNII